MFGFERLRIERLVLWISLIIASEVYAEELPENFVPVRPMGMGNAFTAVANDESSVWTNPAGIARARKARTRNFFQLYFPNVSAGANAKGQKLYSAQTSNSDSSLSDTVSSNGELESDTPYWGAVQAFPVSLFDYERNLPGAIGLFSASSTRILIESDEPTQARVNMISDQGFVTNTTWTTYANRLSVGFQVRYVMRYAYEDTVPTEDIKNKAIMTARLKNDANQSAAAGIDFGALYTYPDFWFPTLGVAVLNVPTGCKQDYLNPHSKKREIVCGSVYSGSVPNEDALSTVDPTDIRVGFAITPRLTRGISLRTAVDAHHLAIPGNQNIGLSGVDSRKILHGGGELFFGNPLQDTAFSVRAGINQGFATTGITLNLGFLALDFASYGVDVSSSAKSIEDRRYIGSVSFVF